MEEVKKIKVWMRLGDGEPVEKEFTDPAIDFKELNALMVQGWSQCGSPAEEQAKPPKKK